MSREHFVDAIVEQVESPMGLELSTVDLEGGHRGVRARDDEVETLALEEIHERGDPRGIALSGTAAARVRDEGNGIEGGRCRYRAPRREPRARPPQRANDGEERPRVAAQHEDLAHLRRRYVNAPRASS